MGDFIGRPAGVVSVDFGGRRTVFLKGQYWLLHTRWALDGKNGVWYCQPLDTAKDTPITVGLTFENDTHGGHIYGALLTKQGYDAPVTLRNLPEVGGSVLAIAVAEGGRQE